MVITELRAIDYFEFIKNIFRDSQYKFLLMSVVRYGDNKKYFKELEEYWSSIDNLTANRIIFLNFTTNSIENGKNYIDVGFEERVVSKGLQPIKQFDLQDFLEKKSGAGYYDRMAKKNEKLASNYYEQYHQKLQSFKLKYLPKLKEPLNRTIDESATQLLEYIGRKESDVPFTYLLDLNKNDEYIFDLNEIYKQYSSLYDFIKSITIKIEEEIIIEKDILDCNSKITYIESELNYKYYRLLKRQKQLDAIPSELREVKRYFNNGKFNTEQTYYLESIIKQRRYELAYPLKDLFPNIKICGTHINSIILKYSNKELDNLEINLRNWIDIESKKIETEKNDSNILVNQLKNNINLNTIKLTLFFNSLIRENYKSKNREMNNFKIALTFAGENRGYVEQVAIELRKKLGEDNIFYDNFFQAELARLDLDIFLQNIYHNKSDFIVVFLSKDYEKKEWCGLEWRSIRDLIKKKQRDKIILVKLDEFNLDGIFSIDGYLDGKTNNPMAISELIYKRICA